MLYWLHQLRLHTDLLYALLAPSVHTAEYKFLIDPLLWGHMQFTDSLLYTAVYKFLTDIFTVRAAYKSLGGYDSVESVADPLPRRW